MASPTLTMSDDRRLAELGQDVVAAAYLKGRFVLRSGAISSYYFDKYKLTTRPEILRRVAGQAGDNLPAGAQQNVPAYDGPAMTTIIGERLGLKLDSQKTPVDVLVIDSAEMPTAD